VKDTAQGSRGEGCRPIFLSPPSPALATAARVSLPAPSDIRAPLVSSPPPAIPHHRTLDARALCGELPGGAPARSRARAVIPATGAFSPSSTVYALRLPALLSFLDDLSRSRFSPKVPPPPSSPSFSDSEHMMHSRYVSILKMSRRF